MSSNEPLLDHQSTNNGDVTPSFNPPIPPVKPSSNIASTTNTEQQPHQQQQHKFGCCEAIMCLGTGCLLAEVCFPDESPCCKAVCYPLCCCFLPFFIFPDKSVKG